MLGAGAAPLDRRVLHIQTPKEPQFRFEWHPDSRRVYLIQASAPTIGEPIAMDIDTHGGAVNAVQIYLRGYRMGRTSLIGERNGEAERQH